MVSAAAITAINSSSTNTNSNRLDRLSRRLIIQQLPLQRPLTALDSTRPLPPELCTTTNTKRQLLRLLRPLQPLPAEFLAVQSLSSSSTTTTTSITSRHVRALKRVHPPVRRHQALDLSSSSSSSLVIGFGIIIWSPCPVFRPQ